MKEVKEMPMTDHESSRFAFLDEGEALRRLGVDRDTLLLLVQEKKLRAYPGVGKGNFYRMKDVEALYHEIYSTSPDQEPGEASPDQGAVPGRKVFDPAYRVQVRLQADLKWYDLEDGDLAAWVRELHADGYTRQRSNITNVIAKLERLVALMDEAAASWRVLQSDPPTSSSKPRRKPLPMAVTPPPPAPDKRDDRV
jgi:hypothetical protein